MADTGPRSASLLGTTLELSVGAPAHGGSCVARHPDGPGGRVVFVRHALPGERVRALVTEDRGGSFCLADAVEIVAPSPARVPPPCPHAGPGRCGGCDWQHASAAAQLELKTAVVREQFSRLAGLSLDGMFGGVEPLAGGLLGWRTRTSYAVGADGHPGLRRHHSHEVEPVERCPLGVPGVGDSAVLADTWPGLSGVEVATGSDGTAAVLGHRPGHPTQRDARRRRGRRPPDRISLLSGPEQLSFTVLGRQFEVQAGGFWQVHPVAAVTFTETLLAFVAPRAGEVVLDLYAGAGALTAPLALAVGASGRVVALELDAAAAADAAANLADLPQAEVRHRKVTADALAALATPDAGPDVRPDVVVLDPPRTGAGRDVMQALLDLRPRCIGYVACDPAALARDVATAQAAGWRLSALRAFDAFPMTHHVECIALLEPAREDVAAHRT